MNLSKFNTNRINLWISALRSGRYNQAYWHPFKNENTRSSLGVACEVYGRYGGTGSYHYVQMLKNLTKQEGIVGCYLPEIFFLPERIMHWYGFDTTDPMLKVDESEDSCDKIERLISGCDLDLSFCEIASAIEETYLKNV